MKTIILVLLSSLLFFSCSKVKQEKLLIDRIILTDCEFYLDSTSILDTVFYYKIYHDSLCFHPGRIIQIKNMQLLLCNTGYYRFNDSARAGCFSIQLNNEDIAQFNEDLQKLNFQNLDSLYNLRKYDTKEYGDTLSIGEAFVHLGQLIFYYNNNKIKLFNFLISGHGSTPYNGTFPMEIRNFITKLFEFAENRRKSRIQPESLFEARRLIITEICKYPLPGGPPPLKDTTKFLPPVKKKHHSYKPSDH